MPKTAGWRYSYCSTDILFTYHSQLALNSYNTPFLKVHICSHYHPIQGQKRLASSWAWAFILSQITKGEKNGDNDGLSQEIEVSHSNCIVYMTGVFDEKDERACSPLSLASCGTSGASLSTSLRAACLTQIVVVVVVSFEGVYLKTFSSWKGFILSKSLTDIWGIFWRVLCTIMAWLIDYRCQGDNWWQQGQHSTKTAPTI